MQWKIATTEHIISIHSLRMEGDTNALLLGMVMNISIHSLRMEGDLVQLRQN